MKVLLMLLVLVGGSIGYPIVRLWTFHELAQAVEEKPNEPQMIPEKEPLIRAFNLMMESLFTGKPDYVNCLLLSPTGEKIWTKTQIEAALHDNKTNPYYGAFLIHAKAALNNYNTDTANKNKQKDTTEVPIIAVDISSWTIEDITKALQDPDTNQNLLPYLRKAQQELEEAATAGKPKKNVSIISPVGLIPPPAGVVPEIVPKNTNLVTTEAKS